MPYEFDPYGSVVIEGDYMVAFSVYHGNYGWYRFNLTVVNIVGELEFLELDWDYFDAEIYDVDGVFLGCVQGESDEDYLLFLAPGGRHVRTWRWDKTVVLNGTRTKLESGVYQLVGVFRGEETIRTEMFDFYFSDRSGTQKVDLSDAALAAKNLREEVMFRIEKGFLWASYGVLVMGFFEDRLIVWLRGWTGWSLDWGGNRAVFWMVTVALSILMLGLTSVSGYVYDVFYV